ncbi:fungal-specific transcription factor domain-containing protein [Trametes polyzona]|nr:fungal-specific transcription factor domain-containing protein [Trametes polyzona]
MPQDAPDHGAGPSYRKPTTRAYKKRRVQTNERACDACRKKKVKCDGPKRSEPRCSNCEARNYDCTYVEPLVRHDYPNSYVESLQIRVRRLEDIIRKRCPDVDLSRLDGASDYESSPTPAAVGSATTAGSPTSPSSSASAPSATKSISVVPRTLIDSDGEDSSDGEDMGIQESLVEGLRQLSLHKIACHYQGKSSGLVFMKPAIALSGEHTGGQSSQGSPRHGPGSPASGQSIEWKEPQPEAEIPAFRDFPPPDLLEHLTQLYFREMNIYMPVLHEPTFRESLRIGEHFRDGGFGALVLLVCANAARFSSDPRVFEEGTTSRLSCGWKWFRQVEMRRKSLLAPSRLYDLQICALMTLFLHGSAQILNSWNVNGLGLRRALELGVHRKHFHGTSPAELELWRRAFWALMLLDWGIGHALGRPCMIDEEELDAPLPIECDDEYWTHEDPAQAFKQPPGKPSKVSFFVASIRLARILAYATRTVYGIRKSQARFAHGERQWQQRIVAELDSSLNKWADSVPEHLKWDPHREDELFLRQSASLHAGFYAVQVAVHRAFILPGHESPLSYPSLSICTNACRACIQVLYGLYRRIGTPLSRNLGMLYMCGIVLFYKRWSNMRAGYSPASDPDLEYVHKCLELIKAVQAEAPTAGGIWDLVHKLLEDDDRQSNASAQKRKHSGNSDVQPSGSEENAPGPNAASQSISHETHSLSTQQPQTAEGAGEQPAPAEFSPSAFAVDFDSAMLFDAPLPLTLDELRRAPDGAFGPEPTGVSAATWQGDPMPGSSTDAAGADVLLNMPVEFQMLFQQGAGVQSDYSHGVGLPFHMEPSVGFDIHGHGGAEQGQSQNQGLPPMFQGGQDVYPEDPNLGVQDFLTSFGWADWDSYAQ